MQVVMAIAIIIFISYLLIRAEKASKKIKTVHDFLSFGDFLDQSDLQKTFEASNASFTTAFVSLFLYAFIFGIFAIGVPIGFCLGIFFYVYVLLPKKMDYLAGNIRYPKLLFLSTNSNIVKIVASIFVLVSLWLFTFAEVQGLNLILRNIFGASEILYVTIPILIVSIIALYIARGGYRAILLTDKIQMYFIYLGSISVLIISLITIRKIGWLNAINNISTIWNPFGSIKDAMLFLVETIVGFLFSQLLYFDNWQRLSFYVSESISRNNESLDKIYGSIKSNYLKGAGLLLFVYLMPVLLGYSIISSGKFEGDIPQIVACLNSTASTLPIIGYILTSFIVLQFVAALMSTADTYTISAVNTFYEDILNQSLEENNKDLKSLSILRISSVLFVVSILFVTFINPNFETLFLYMFYSANGFVGPIVFALLKRKIKPWTVVFSISFGFLYPLGSFFIIPLIPYFRFPGIITVLVSIIVTWIFSKKELEV